jgi:hypothetical protein
MGPKKKGGGEGKKVGKTSKLAKMNEQVPILLISISDEKISDKTLSYSFRTKSFCPRVFIHF